MKAKKIVNKINENIFTRRTNKRNDVNVSTSTSELKLLHDEIDEAPNTFFFDNNGVCGGC